jgi:hypothetical protein
VATRRDVLRYTAATVALTSCGRADANTGGAHSHDAIPRRALGKTGVQISAMGLGASHLGSMNDPDEAVRVVHAAIDAGVTFFDNAWEYHDGKSEELLGRALAGKRDQVFVMTKVCTHGRGVDVAMAQLEESVRRLKTDHLAYDNPEARKAHRFPVKPKQKEVSEEEKTIMGAP